jgi:hypothetical protein
MGPDDQAAIAFDALLTFMVKTDVGANLDRLMDFVMEAWEGSNEAEATVFDAAREFINATRKRREQLCYGPRKFPRCPRCGADNDTGVFCPCGQEEDKPEPEPENTRAESVSLDTLRYLASHMADHDTRRCLTRSVEEIAMLRQILVQSEAMFKARDEWGSLAYPAVQMAELREAIRKYRGKAASP